MTRILITNDDGVNAPGIAVLADELAEIAQVQVVAPDRNRSGASNSLTLDKPLSATKTPHGFMSIDGTPTDCVHLSITGLLEEPPQMVVSGINAGANLGDDVLYSGTVAAASEGRFLKHPAIAVSLVGGEEHYQTAAKVTRGLVEHLWEHFLPEGTILNVNVPNVPYEELRGYEVTRLGTRHCAEPTIKAEDPRGGVVYWVGLPGNEADSGPGTDFHAVRNNKVAITPLQLDMTHYSMFERLSDLIGNFAP